MRLTKLSENPDNPGLLLSAGTIAEIIFFFLLGLL